MSLQRLGVNPDGTRRVVFEEPGRARCHGYGSSLVSHAITIGGSFVQGGPGAVERQRKAERDFKARHKA